MAEEMFLIKEDKRDVQTSYKGDDPELCLGRHHQDNGEINKICGSSKSIEPGVFLFEVYNGYKGHSLLRKAKSVTILQQIL